MELSAFYIVTLGAVALLGVLLLLVLFEPGLSYEVRADELPLSGSRESLGLIAALVDVPVMGRSPVEVLTDGTEFYREDLDAIRSARRSIDLEAYIFHRSRIADQFLDMLAGRSRTGVKVRMIVDAIGSMGTPNFGIILDPALGAVFMSASTVICAINSKLLRLK